MSSAVVQAVAGCMQKREVKSREAYLAILEKSHQGKYVKSEDIAEVLRDADVTIQQFERDLHTLATRKSHQDSLTTAIEQAKGAGAASEKVQAMYAERQQWERDFRARLSVAIGDEQEARDAVGRITQLTQQLVASSQNPALVGKLTALRDELAENSAKIRALEKELEDGQRSADNAVHFLRCGRKEESPEPEAVARRKIIADWPATKERIKAEVAALDLRSADIPAEIEALTPEFVASVL